MSRENSKNLLDLLVQEFRIWQDLARLTRAERAALIACEALLLADLARQKGELLSKLAAHQQTRRELMTEYTASCPPSSGAPPHLTPGEAGRLLRLVEGIQTLADQIGELAQGNYALADCAMRRAWALQGWVRQESQQSLPALLAGVLAAPPPARSRPVALSPFCQSPPEPDILLGVPTSWLTLKMGRECKPEEIYVSA